MTIIDIDTAVSLIVNQIGRYELEVRLNAASLRVVDAFVLLFTIILDYLLEAKTYFTKPLAIRTVKAPFKAWQLKTLLQTLENQKLVVDREMQAAKEARKSPDDHVTLSIDRRSCCRRAELSIWYVRSLLIPSRDAEEHDTQRCRYHVRKNDRLCNWVSRTKASF